MLIKWHQVLVVLFNDAHILHHDISPNNIMLVHDDDGKVLHVLLINFDHASTLKVDDDVSSASIFGKYRTVRLVSCPSLSPS